MKKRQRRDAGLVERRRVGRQEGIVLQAHVERRPATFACSTSRGQTELEPAPCTSSAVVAHPADHVEVEVGARADRSGSARLGREAARAEQAQTPRRTRRRARRCAARRPRQLLAPRRAPRRRRTRCRRRRGGPCPPRRLRASELPLAPVAEVVVVRAEHDARASAAPARAGRKRQRRCDRCAVRGGILTSSATVDAGRCESRRRAGCRCRAPAAPPRACVPARLKSAVGQPRPLTLAATMPEPDSGGVEGQRAPSRRRRASAGRVTTRIAWRPARARERLVAQPRIAHQLARSSSRHAPPASSAARARSCPSRRGRRSCRRRRPGPRGPQAVAGEDDAARRRVPPSENDSARTCSVPFQRAGSASPARSGSGVEPASSVPAVNSNGSRNPSSPASGPAPSRSARRNVAPRPCARLASPSGGPRAAPTPGTTRGARGRRRPAQRQRGPRRYREDQGRPAATRRVRLPLRRRRQRRQDRLVVPFGQEDLARPAAAVEVQARRLPSGEGTGRPSNPSVIGHAHRLLVRPSLSTRYSSKLHMPSLFEVNTT